MDLRSRPDGRTSNSLHNNDIHGRNSISTHDDNGNRGNKVLIETEMSLKKEFGLPSAIATATGSVIGSGIFIMPTAAAMGGGSVGLTLILWFSAGLFNTMGALAYAELGTLIPESGSTYTYLRETYNRWLAYLSAWNMMILQYPAGQAVVGMTFAKYSLALAFSDGCGDPPEHIVKLLAAIVCVAMGLLNMYSVRLTARVHVVATVAKVMALVMIIVGGIVKLCQGHTENLATGFANTNTNAGEIAMGYYGCMFAYGGWDGVLTITEEVKNPKKNIPLTMYVSLILITVLYTLTNMSYLTVMSIDDMLKSQAVGVTWGERVLGYGAFIIPICVAISTMGAINANVMSSSRLHYVLARDGLWPRILSMIHVESYTPVPAVLITMLLSIIYIYTGGILSLVAFTSFVMWIFYALTMIAVLVLRVRMKDAERPYKVPLLYPILYTLFCMVLALVPLVTSPRLEFLYAILVILAGYVIYIPFVTFNLTLPGIDKLTCVVQQLMQVCPTTPNTT